MEAELRAYGINVKRRMIFLRKHSCAELSFLYRLSRQKRCEFISRTRFHRDNRRRDKEHDGYFTRKCFRRNRCTIINENCTGEISFLMSLYCSGCCSSNKRRIKRAEGARTFARSSPPLLLFFLHLPSCSSSREVFPRPRAHARTHAHMPTRERRDGESGK